MSAAPPGPPRPLRLTARWLIPVDAPPVRDAALLLGADGRVAALGPAESVPAPPGVERIDLGEAALLPGLVNAHTHLELTGFEGQATEDAFPDWILTIRRLKEGRSADEFLVAARRGIRDCWAAGVTTVADTGDSGAVLRALAELGGSGIAYHEVFGPHPAQADASFTGLRTRIAELAPLATGRVRIGVSPHAPYTVSGPLFRRVGDWARREGLPIAVHIAESREEAAFVAEGAGPFAAAWGRRGIPLLDDVTHAGPARDSRRSALAWLDAHGILGHRTLCIHAVQADPGDVALLAGHRAAVAHCPLSNVRHRHGAAPLAAFRSAGLRVGLGTDSVASVGRLDLLAEARAAAALGSLDPGSALGLCTLEGARALGLEAEIGSLTVGKWGDVAAIRLPAAGGGGAPEPAVLATGPDDVLLTVLGGRIVHRPPA